MSVYWLKFRLESDGTFGRGDGTPGLVDQEVALDADGCPYMHGRTLKGLISEACADILYALEPDNDAWRKAADALLGTPSSDLRGQGVIQVGHAQLPAPLRQAIQYELRQKKWTRDDVIHALTTVRTQTAMKNDGSPEDHSLRSVRVILRETLFEAQLMVQRELTPSEQGLLAACVKGLRRVGTARNRGRGRVVACLTDEGDVDVTSTWFKLFTKEVCP